MSIYSKQKIFCNACGVRMETELPQVRGRDFKCCSMECVREMQWRETLSILNKPYTPDPDPERKSK